MAYATDLDTVKSILAVVGLDANSIPATGSGASLEDIQGEAYQDVRSRVYLAGCNPDALGAEATAIAARLENLLTAEAAIVAGQFQMSRDQQRYFTVRMSSAMASFDAAMQFAGTTKLDASRRVGVGSMVSNADNFWPETAN